MTGKKIKEQDYTIINADCMEVFKTMPDNFIDVVVCDPPYPTTKHGKSGLGGAMGRLEFGKGSGGFDYNDLPITTFLGEVYRVMKPNAHGYLMTNQLNLYKFLDAFQEYKRSRRDQGLSIYKVLIWDKMRKTMNPYYMEQYEFIIFFRKGRAKKIINSGTSSLISVGSIATPPSPSKKDGIIWKKLHEAIKPVQLLKILIENSTNEGDIVLDFTMGSGSTGLAALLTNRKFIGIQIDPKYYLEAKRRIISFDENLKRMSPRDALKADREKFFFLYNDNEKEKITNDEGDMIWYEKGKKIDLQKILGKE